MRILPSGLQQGNRLPKLQLINQAGNPVTSDGGVPDNLDKETTVNTVNEFKFNNALLKSVRDYGNIVKGVVQSRQVTYEPDGTIRSKFIASRQVTIQDPSLIAQLRPLIADNAEFVVNLSGYLTTTVREIDGKAKWYDNQVVTQIEFLQ